MIEKNTIIDGKYKIIKEIGRGGMSQVYLVINQRVGKHWAMKTVNYKQCKNNDLAIKSLTKELYMLKRLQHRFLPNIIDIVEENHQLCIIMDYIEGQPLENLLRQQMATKHCGLNPELVLDVARQLCQVFIYLHSQNPPIIYGDLKPSNIIVRPDGQICLIDFGTAVFKEQIEKIHMGTAGFAAPEQYNSDTGLVPETDIFAFGAVIYYLLTGCKAKKYAKKEKLLSLNQKQIMTQETSGYVKALSGLERILDKCIQSNVENRYHSFSLLYQDILRVEKLGSYHIMKLKLRLKIFFLVLFCSIGFVALAFMAYRMERYTLEYGCNYLFELAETAKDTEKIYIYGDLIKLNPKQEKAYIDLLVSLIQDQDFSLNDEQMIISLLNQREVGRDQTNRQYLMESREGYAQFAYYMGIAYYYFMGPEGDKKSANGWLKIAIQEDFLNQNAYQPLAQILYKISSYYNSHLGKVSQWGEGYVSYKEYWDDLMSLYALHKIGKDNLMIQLQIDYEIVYQIYTKTRMFIEEGHVSPEEMENILADIESNIPSENMTAQETELQQQLVQMISNTRLQLTTLMTNA